ncbi:hypothetical protein V1477_018161, partial [Vespula maculifrons]
MAMVAAGDGISIKESRATLYEGSGKEVMDARGDLVTRGRFREPVSEARVAVIKNSMHPRVERSQLPTCRKSYNVWLRTTECNLVPAGVLWGLGRRYSG